jgi:pimeloyl-ACP methyl ester carboxylesterase
VRARRVAGHGGVDLAVFERGEPDRPTVVLVHGYPDTSAVWQPVADRLADRFHVVTYDVRGAGRSAAPPHVRDYGVGCLVEDLAAVVRATADDRPVHVVGHDWGSIQLWEAVTASWSNPAAIAAQIASFTSISGPGLDHIRAWVQARLRPGPRHWRELLRQGARSWYVYAFQVPVLVPATWRLGLARAWPRLVETREGATAGPGWPAPTVAGDAARGVRLYRANLLRRPRPPEAATTDVPVQLIVPLDDHFVTPALLDDTSRFASRLWRRDVAGGHWILRSDPDRVVRWIEELIDLVDGGVEAPALARARQPVAS